MDDVTLTVSSRSPNPMKYSGLLGVLFGMPDLLFLASETTAYCCPKFIKCYH